MFLTVSITLYIPVGNHAFGQTVTQTPQFLTIDLSGTPTPNDFPYGITCDDPNYVWVTIHGQGKLARVDKSTQSVSLFDNVPLSTSREWYSTVYHSGSDDLFVNERDNGLVLRYDKATNTWTNIPIVSNFDSPDNVNISYPDGYTNEPAKIRLNEATHGQHTYDFSTGSFGEMKLTNGYVWVLLNYSWDFDSEGEVILADQSFNGVVRINPSDNSITQFAISGSSALRGMSVDVNDSSILWITDSSQNKIYKFDTNSNSVTQTISVAVSSPILRGITNDATTLYIAMNQVGGSGNSKILHVDKSTLTETVVDTGALNNNGGAFSVFIVGNLVIWTDQSGHYGTYDKTNIANTKTITTTTGQTSSNHFGCVVGTEFWFAGQGSAKVGSFSLSSSSESSHGDSCMGDCYAPHLGNDENSRFFYDDGLKINGIAYEVKNVLHNMANQTLIFPVGEQVNFELKVQDSYPNNVSSCEIAVGIKQGHFIKQDASYIIGTKRTFDGVISLYEEGDTTAFRDVSTSIENVENNVIVKTSFTPTKHIVHDMFAIECKDMHGYYTTYFFNHGIKFVGKSENGVPIFEYMDDDGRIHVLKIVDETLENLNIAIDENGDYWYGEFGSLWNKEFVRPDMRGSLSKHHGYDRDDYFEFKAYKFGQELLAKHMFDSSMIQNTIKPSFSYETTFYDRLHDPVPNMMNALGEYEKSKPDVVIRSQN